MLKYHIINHRNTFLRHPLQILTGHGEEEARGLVNVAGGGGWGSLRITLTMNGLGKILPLKSKNI